MSIIKDGHDVTNVFVGETLINGAYVGNRIIFPTYVETGLEHHFDGLDNLGTGVHDSNASTWKDLITGTSASLTNTVWQPDGIALDGDNSLISYTGVNVPASYTIFSTHTVTKMTGMYPRFYAEHPYPSLYLSYSRNYSYTFYGHGKDTEFLPRFQPPLNTKIHTAVRYIQNGGKVEIFINGVPYGTIPVSQNAGTTATKHLGNRGSDRLRGLTGIIHEHMVYTRALTNEEIMNNFRVSQGRYMLTQVKSSNITYKTAYEKEV